MKVEWARIGDLAEQIRGVSYGKEDASSIPLEGYLPVLRAGNITDAGLLFDDLVFVPAERVSRKQRVRQHDIIVAASSGSLNVVGKAAPALSDFDGGFGAFCKVIRPGPRVAPAYLAHFFKTQVYRRAVSALAAGININNLRGEHLDNLEIPLPPLPEQRRIADILDRAEALRAHRCAALAKLDTLTQAIFIEMFGDPVANPKGLPRVPLGEAMTQVYRYPTYYDITYEPAGVAEVRGELILDTGQICSDPSRLRFISPATSAQFPRTVLAAGDLVMTVRGTIGKVGLVPPELAGANITANLIRLAPARDILDPLFAWHFMQTDFFKGRLQAASSSTTISTIKAPDLKCVPLLLPPLPQQMEFNERVNSTVALRSSYRSSLARLDDLFASLQDRAFRGEL